MGELQKPSSLSPKAGNIVIVTDSTSRLGLPAPLLAVGPMIRVNDEVPCR